MIPGAEKNSPREPKTLGALHILGALYIAWNHLTRLS